ncbi:MAG: hypothetical protein JOZ69_25545 [Myxococcales bacterium]|nr:hypothetical protein [Myxococcales bacterium]
MLLAPLLACNSKTIELHSDRVASLVRVSKEPDLDAGIDGQMEQFLSTAFQPAVWQSQFFAAHPDEQDPDASALAALGGQHVLVQVQDPPWKLVAPGTVDWDFGELDAIVGPLTKLGLDPVLQLNQAPPSAFVGSFADYCASLVRYYNGDGVSLTDGGVARSTVGPIRWWGIWSDSNTTNAPGVRAANVLENGTEFAGFYNEVVSAMRAVDPNLRFAAPEYNDCTEGTDPCRRTGPTFKRFIAEFLATTEDGGASGAPTPVDALSVHMFATSYATPDDAGLSWSDRQVFDTVPLFAGDISAFRTALAQAGRANTSVWVTENQVNSDVPNLDGTSVHANHQEGLVLPFHADARGTSAFFAAWRPALFSQLGKAGNRGLFQWEFTAGQCPDADVGNCSHEPYSDTDPQNAEVDYQSGKKYLSYWVDYWLAHKFPPGGTILQADSQDPDVEVLGTSQPALAGAPPSTVVMVVNSKVASDGDKNGPGAPWTVIVDLQAFHNGATKSPAATLMMIDARTDLDAGPAESPVSASDLQAGWIPVTFGGYGVAFLTLAGSTGP